MKKCLILDKRHLITPVKDFYLIKELFSQYEIHFWGDIFPSIYDVILVTYNPKEDAGSNFSYLSWLRTRVEPDGKLIVL
jgi:hypothetical protein